ncbi:hypothetical protein DEJ16_02250 [Curtobacterium sp. MCJR17_055]|nr:hypothetical protein DEI87_03895 [Curtobacterium sp. MCBD17_029]PYY58075.1 hypothetical protein DEJ26_10940 [Curtobacterium sp. MCPF17_015]PYY58525.1 hypothetical protein DEJ16_02250 [Curtobacterium sp. MCJR17_055]
MMTDAATNPLRTSAEDLALDATERAIAGVERQFLALAGSTRRTMREQAAQMELQPAGYRVLLEVVVNGSTGAGELAEALGYDKTALSRQLSALEALGFVTRERHAVDRRAVVVRATPDAVERVQRIRASARSAFRERLVTWPRTDLEDLARLLAALS